MMSRQITLAANCDPAPNRAKAIKIIRPYVGSLRFAVDAVENGWPVTLAGTATELDEAVLRLIDLEAVAEI